MHKVDIPPHTTVANIAEVVPQVALEPEEEPDVICVSVNHVLVKRDGHGDPGAYSSAQ